MATNPTDLLYTTDHEWVRVDGDGTVRVGITAYAQRQLGDIVFVDVPSRATALEAGDAIGTLESVKAVTEIYMPVDGQVTTVNPALDGDPELINQDPYGEGWIAQVKPANRAQLDALMSAAQYESRLAEPTG
ncbi:glycine cleavage system protein GcvH [Streptomyces sp. NPDC047928]|uniref:glycine cleavage system protein GcvH n=1 Tax=unclassified Streptomyces TaxID=2593676 RepID=UPI0037191C81